MSTSISRSKRLSLQYGSSQALGLGTCTTSVGSPTGQLPKQRYDKLKVAGVLFLIDGDYPAFSAFFGSVSPNVFKQAQANIIIQVQLVDLFVAKHSDVPVRTKPNRVEPRRPTRAYITKAWNKLPTNVQVGTRVITGG